MIIEISSKQFAMVVKTSVMAEEMLSGAPDEVSRNMCEAYIKLSKMIIENVKDEK